MPFTRTLPEVTCPDPLHYGARVRAWGTYTRKSGTYRSYHCRPRVGRAHRFSVKIAAGRRARRHPGAPACLAHPDGRVTRAGGYGRGVARRQRYRCDHACGAACRQGCSGHHTFTPFLPRGHVHVGDTCAECLELRGFHRGERAAARRHWFPARVVARALAEMSLKASYADAGRLALDAIHVRIDVPRRKPSANPRRPRRRWSQRKARTRSAASRAAGRFWQIGAGFVEAFAPVVWQATEERLRERAAKIVATGKPPVWLLDEIPVYALDASGKRKKTDGWVVLVLAEMDWTDHNVPGASKLRLVRAMPKATGVAWRLAFAEVGYVPDVIVSDAATSIIAAVGRHFDGPGPLFVPSLWHLGQALRNNSLKAALRGARRKEIGAHLAELGREGSAMRSVADWHAWWDQLEALAAGSGEVKMDALRQSRANYETRMAAALPTLLAEPELKMSTGGLETIMHKHIDPVLDGRRHQFGNIERTNNLLDLVVCRANGAFTDLNAVAALLEADEEPWRGWTVPLRAVADPLPAVGAYRSLRDEMLMVAVAEERGLL
jgi:hypothetical protein